MVTKESIFYDSRAPERQIHAIKWQPAGEVKAVFIIAHGMAEYIERYDPFATYLAERGILVAGCDYLGHGKSVNGGHEPYGYFCKRDPATVVIRDVHRLKKMIQEDYPGVPQVIMGHSMGSFVVRNYLCRYGTGVNAAILMGTGMPGKMLIGSARFIANLQAAFIGGGKPGKLLNKMAFGGYNKKIKDSTATFAWLSVNAENVKNYEDDPLCGQPFSINGFQTLLELPYRILKPKNLANMPPRLPILIVSGTEDPVGDYGRGPKKTRQSLRKAGVHDVEVNLYPWGRHEILMEAEKMEVYTDIINWLTEKLDLELE
jgi:alpha-beta hydrolase superfamily lysophospholipase